MKVLSLESLEYVANGNVGGNSLRRSVSSNEREKTGVLRGNCRDKGPNYLLGLGRERGMIQG